jgi:hypothetical protein
VNAESERIVGITNPSGLSVEVVCADGDSTHVCRLAAPFALVGVPESYELQLPLHRQSQLRARVGMPGSFACFCHDVGHQGMRDLYVNGVWLMVFPRFDGDSCEFVTHVGVLRSAGVATALLRDSAPGKMDHVLAAKVWSAEVLLAISERLHELIGLVDPGTPPPIGASEQDLAAFWGREERYREEMRHSCAAYWLHVVWVCIYQTMHGDLPLTQRVLVACHGFCTVLGRVTMRQCHSP